MFQLAQGERIDWFRILIDLDRSGMHVSVISVKIGIPQGTIKGWKARTGRPRVEEGMQLIDLWVQQCKRSYQDVPRYNPYRH